MKIMPNLKSMLLRMSLIGILMPLNELNSVHTMPCSTLAITLVRSTRTVKELARENAITLIAQHTLESGKMARSTGTVAII